MKRERVVAIGAVVVALLWCATLVLKMNRISATPEPSAPKPNNDANNSPDLDQSLSSQLRSSPLPKDDKPRVAEVGDHDDNRESGRESESEGKSERQAGQVERSGVVVFTPTNSKGEENNNAAGEISHDREVELRLAQKREGKAFAPVDGGSELEPCPMHRIYGMWDAVALDPSTKRHSSGAVSLCELEDLSFLQGGNGAFAKNVEDWCARYPRMEQLLWTQDSAELFLKATFPELLLVYQGFERPVMRSDLLRYLLVLHFGGWYADMDIRASTNSLDELRVARPETELFAFTETILSPTEAAANGRRYAIREGVAEDRVRLANYFFGGSASSSALQSVVNQVRQRAGLRVREDYDVLFVTGPDAFTTAVHSHMAGVVGGDNGGEAEGAESGDGGNGVGGGVEGVEGEGGVGGEDAGTAAAAAAAAAERRAAVDVPGAMAAGVVVVDKPADQAYFRHDATGTWRQQPLH